MQDISEGKKKRDDMKRKLLECTLSLPLSSQVPHHLFPPYAAGSASAPRSKPSAPSETQVKIEVLVLRQREDPPVIKPKDRDVKRCLGSSKDPVQTGEAPLKSQ